MKYGNRSRVQQKIRHLAPLDGCTCAFEEWIYGRQKKKKSHDMAYMLLVVIRIASPRQFNWVPTTYVCMEKYGNTSSNTHLNCFSACYIMVFLQWDYVSTHISLHTSSAVRVLWDANYGEEGSHYLGKQVTALKNKGTVQILGFWTDRSGQTVLTQIRLLQSMIKPILFNFRILGVQIFQFFMALWKMELPWRSVFFLYINWGSRP